MNDNQNGIDLILPLVYSFFCFVLQSDCISNAGHSYVSYLDLFEFPASKIDSLRNRRPCFAVQLASAVFLGSSSLSAAKTRRFAGG